MIKSVIGRVREGAPRGEDFDFMRSDDLRKSPQDGAAHTDAMQAARQTRQEKWN
jgi:hypothetical protein